VVIKKNLSARQVFEQPDDLWVPNPLSRGFLELDQGVRPGFLYKKITVARQRRTFTGFVIVPAHPGVKAP
jgi:hypothetical protein